MNTENSVFLPTLLLINHALKVKRITGHLPDHRYLISVFEIPYGFADHVLDLVQLVLSSKEREQ